MFHLLETPDDASPVASFEAESAEEWRRATETVPPGRYYLAADVWPGDNPWLLGRPSLGYAGFAIGPCANHRAEWRRALREAWRCFHDLSQLRGISQFAGRDMPDGPPGLPRPDHGGAE